MPAKDKSNEIHITRLYDAPVTLVWDAWTEPEKTALWWGPRGHSIKTHSKDLRKGGSWSYTMFGPAGEIWENKTIYLEVETYKKLVYDHGGNDDRPPLFRVTVLFAEKNGKTKMDMTMTLATPEAAEQTKKFIKQAGGNSTWDRLAEYLDKELDGSETFVINRSFEVPITTMFKMWTDPDQVSKWLPPTGFNMKFIRANIKTGGSSFYSMFNDDNSIIMSGKAEYLEVDPPKKLVYTQQFCDENEKLSRHPAAPTWPATMITVVTFTEEGTYQTRVTVEWQVHGTATAEEMQTFINGKPGMTLGWTGSFDKLESLLEN